MPANLLFILGAIGAVSSAMDPVSVARPAGVTGPIGAVATSENGVVVVVEAGVRVLDPTGRPLRTWRREDSGRARRRRGLVADGDQSAPGLPADFDWALDYAIEDIDDPDDPRLADEAGAGGRDVARTSGLGRQAAVSTSAPAIAVAAGGHFAWLASPDGLRQIDFDTGGVLSAWAGNLESIRGVAASPDGRTVAFASGATLYRSLDGGGTFEGIRGLEEPVHSLAAMNSGAIVVTDVARGPARSLAPDRIEFDILRGAFASDVVSCGEVAVLLTPGGASPGGLFVVRWSKGSSGPRVEQAAGLTRQIDRLTCGTDGQLWAASGEDLLRTQDQGRSWSVAGRLPPGSIAGLGVGRSALWIAASSGLWTMSLSTTARERTADPAPETDGRARAAPPMARVTELGTFPWWSILLPRVDLLFALARQESRRDMRALVLLTFAVNGRRRSLGAAPTIEDSP